MFAYVFRIERIIFTRNVDNICYIVFSRQPFAYHFRPYVTFFRRYFLLNRMFLYLNFQVHNIRKHSIVKLFTPL